MSTYAPIILRGLGNSPATIVKPTPDSPAYGIGLLCTVSAGAGLTYSVQVTNDPIPTDGGNWNEHDTLTLQTGSSNGDIAYAVNAVRLVVTAWSSGSVNLGIGTWP